MLQALYWLVSWIFRAAVIKFVTFAGIAALMLVLYEFLTSMLDFAPLTDLQNQWGSLPADLLYYAGLFQLHIGIPIVLAAYLTRFAIRRIPVIG